MRVSVHLCGKDLSVWVSDDAFIVPHDHTHICFTEPARSISDAVPSASSVSEPIYLGGRSDRQLIDTSGIRAFPDRKTESQRDVFKYRHAGGLSVAENAGFQSRQQARLTYEDALRANAVAERHRVKEEYNRLRQRPKSANPAMADFLYEVKP